MPETRAPRDRSGAPLHRSLPGLGVSLHEASRPSPDPGAGLAAVRVLLALMVPVVVLYLNGRGDLCPWAILGGFTAIYGRGRTVRARLPKLAGAAAALLASVLQGLVAAWSSQPPWAVILLGALVCGVTGWLSLRFDWRPPGPLFPLIAFSVTAHAPRHDPVTLAAAATVTAAAAIVAIITALLLPEGARSGYDRPDPQSREPARFTAAAEYTAAAAVAGLLAMLTGLNHTYWAMLAAVVPMMAVTAQHRLLRATHRLVGTILGLLLGVTILAAVPLTPPVAIALVIILQASTELVIRRHYGWALLLVTPLALIMTQLLDPQPTQGLLLDRVGQTALGVTVAVATVSAQSIWLRIRRSGA